MVGSNQGQVHSERQGTGLATVLQGDRAYIEGQQNLGQYQLDRKAKQVELKGRRDSAWKALNDFHPEFWNVHNAEIQGAMDSLVDEGGRLIAASKTGDPFTDVTPEALAFQKKFNEVRAMAQRSKQMMAQDNAIRQDLNGKNPDDFLAEDIVAWNDWQKSPLSEGRQAPIIRKATPLLSLTKEAGAVRTAFAEQFGENEVPNDALIKNTRDQFTDPKWAAGIVPALTQSYLSLTPAEQLSVQEAADANHLSLPEQLWTDISKRSLKMGKPFELNAFVDKLAKDFQVDEIAYGNAEGTGKTFDKKKYEAEKQRRALLGTLDDPRAVDALLKAGIIEKEIGDDELALRKKAAAVLAKEIDSRVKTSTGFVPYKDAAEAKQAEVFENRWYADLTKGGMETAVGAAKEILDRKRTDGYTISDAKVLFPGGEDYPMQKIGSPSPRILKLKVKSPTKSFTDDESVMRYIQSTTGASRKTIDEVKVLRYGNDEAEVSFQMLPENENAIRNLFDPGRAASSYSSVNTSPLLGSLTTAKPIEKTAIKKAPLNVRGK